MTDRQIELQARIDELLALRNTHSTDGNPILLINKTTITKRIMKLNKQLKKEKHE